MKRLFFVIYGVAIGFGSLALFLLLAFPKETDLGNRIGFEIAKFVFQLLIVGLAGSYWVQKYNQLRDRKEAANEFRKGFLTRLVQAYTSVKRTRLLLRAKAEGELKPAEDPLQGRGPGSDLRRLAWEAYETQMGLIGEAAVELEMLLRDLDFFPEAFAPGRRETLKTAIGQMEDYLKALLKEYRDRAREARKNGTVDLAGLRAVSSFARGSDQGSNFRAGFSGPFYGAIQQIQDERLKV